MDPEEPVAGPDGGREPELHGRRGVQEDRTFNEANELTQRGVDANNTAGYEQTFNPVHDDMENLLDDGLVARVFDAFGHLTQITTRATPGVLMAQYTYNGLNWLTSRVSDHAVALSQPDDGTVDGDDITCFYAYDASWRVIAEYRESDADPRKRRREGLRPGATSRPT